MTSITAAAADAGGADRPLERSIQALRVRDNHTNFLHVGAVYGVIAATAVAAVWLWNAHAAWGLDAVWRVAVVLIAILIMGASQHQLGGAVHEATHYMLFRNRRLNELASDWLCAFPLYTTTYQYRIHHLAHHQFVNDPQRDPDIAQLRDSGHWLDFPVDHMTFLKTLLKQLWLPNLVRYTVTRARYSALGTDGNPYHDPRRQGSKWPTRVMIAYAVLVPVIQGRVAALGDPWLLAGTAAALCSAVVGYLAAVPECRYAAARIQPVVSHRATAVSRVGFLAAVYGGLSCLELVGKPAGLWFLVLWVVPLFTTFPLFMVLRQWVQHGNGDRGRLTNTRVFLVNPLIRYAVFPFGMDYHLPHHLYASIPHYKLPQLHAALMDDPEYARDGVVVRGYFLPASGDRRDPTVLEVLGPRHAPRGGDAYIDAHALDDADVVDLAAIERQAQDSARAARGPQRSTWA